MALRILIVDDSDTTRRILGTILRSRHWTVCGEAEDGRSGIRQFQKLKPDLVVIDGVQNGHPSCRLYAVDIGHS